VTVVAVKGGERKTHALRNQLLLALHPNGYRDLRALCGHARPEVRNVDAADLSAVDAFAESYCDRNLYVGVAIRATASRRDTDGCRELHALFVDLDYKNVDEHEARQRVAAFRPEPSAVVASGGGLHLYWLLEEPFDLQNGARGRRSASYVLSPLRLVPTSSPLNRRTFAACPER
jgi:hypothetical protein